MQKVNLAKIAFSVFRFYKKALNMPKKDLLEIFPNAKIEFLLY